MTDREKILIALRETPLKAFEIMKRVNIKHQDDSQSLLLKMRDDGGVSSIFTRDIGSPRDNVRLVTSGW